jgi:hypothetical protein
MVAGASAAGAPITNSLPRLEWSKQLLPEVWPKSFVQTGRIGQALKLVVDSA